MTTKATLMQNIKWHIEPEHKIPYHHIDTIVNQFIEEIKKAIIGKQKIVIHGLMKIDSKVVDEKTGFF
ncbi:MAG: nucleoid DNA-binding protein [Sulfurimonas sp.]|jgi:nucleoid DNA-binding protein